MPPLRPDIADDEPPNKTLRWNVIGVCLALLIAIGLVFLLDTGEFVDWIARHRGTKLDETIVVAVVFLAGLCTYFVRRWLGLSSRLSNHSDQGSATVSIRQSARSAATHSGLASPW